jgi:hypothetical protein
MHLGVPHTNLWTNWYTDKETVVNVTPLEDTDRQYTLVYTNSNTAWRKRELVKGQQH